MDYENVPSVVFSHPPIGTIGLTEEQAVIKYSAENIKVYWSEFVNMYYSLIPDSEQRPKTLLKVICNLADNEWVIGVHIVGWFADEIIQGVGIAMKMGATKKDLDWCVAIHPTAGEEIVLLDPKYE